MENREVIAFCNSVIMVADKFMGKVESGRARSVETYDDLRKLKNEALLIKSHFVTRVEGDSEHSIVVEDGEIKS